MTVIDLGKQCPRRSTMRFPVHGSIPAAGSVHFVLALTARFGILCAILTAACDAKAKYLHAMQPDTLQIACDATMVESIKWSDYRITGESSLPTPKTIFDATVN
jgi:hypothetical protein